MIVVPLYDRGGGERGTTHPCAARKYRYEKEGQTRFAGTLSQRGQCGRLVVSSTRGYAARRIFGAPSRQAATARANLPTLFLMGDIYRETLGAVDSPQPCSPRFTLRSPFPLSLLSLSLLFSLPARGEGTRFDPG